MREATIIIQMQIDSLTLINTKTTKNKPIAHTLELTRTDMQQKIGQNSQN